MAWQFFHPDLVILAWGGVTIAPVILALGARWLTFSIRSSWLVHLLFLPTVIVVEWMGVDLLFVVNGDNDGDGIPGLGLALIPTIAIMIGTLSCYYGALGIRFVSIALADRKRDGVGGQKAS